MANAVAKDDLRGVVFLVTPELSIPPEEIQPVLEALRARESSWVAILGLGYQTAEEALSLIQGSTTEGPIRERALRLLRGADAVGSIVNMCLVTGCSVNGESFTYPQFKITPAPLEGSSRSCETILHGDYILHLLSPEMGFVTLTCSDFFQRAPGSSTLILDKVEYELLKGPHRDRLDFIFNIQYNSSPLHETFLRGFRRLFDDHEELQSNVCVVVANAWAGKGATWPALGSSHVAFASKTKLPNTEQVREVNAPIAGYELPDAPVLARFAFDRPPRDWNRLDKSLQFALFDVDENGNMRPKDGPMRRLKPRRDVPSVTYGSLLDLAQTLSNRGQFEEAREWAIASKQWSLESGDLASAARAAHFLYKQSRHIGRLGEALVELGRADDLQTQVSSGGNDFESLMLHWRLRGGRIMVDDYLISGDCTGAINKYEDLIREANDIRNELGLSVPQSRKLNDYQLHARRQIAEMRRILGNFESALTDFKLCVDRYAWSSSVEAAFALLGVGDCLRGLGKILEARERYEEVEYFAGRDGNQRLLARTLRNRAELERVAMHLTGSAEKDVNGLLDELERVSDECSYLYGRLWSLLIRAAIHLDAGDVTAPAPLLGQAASLCKVGNGRTLMIENAYVMFGNGELARLRGDIQQALSFYSQALLTFEKRRIPWGVIRVSRAIETCGVDRPRISGEIIDLAGPLEHDLLQEPLPTCLFLNLP